MVESEKTEQQKKRAFSSFFMSIFSRLLSPSSRGDATKRSSTTNNGRFSFKRRSLEKESVSMAEGELALVDKDATTTTSSVVTFKGDQSSNAETARPQGNRTSIKKRPSSRRFMGISRGKSQKFEITEEMISLQRIICDSSYRQKLIEMLIPLDGDSSVKVRFCSAVEEYQREKDKKTKNKKAAQIVKMFVRKGSMFRLKGLSVEHEKALKSKKYETLEALKNTILDELVLNLVVSRTMKEILESENVLKDSNNNNSEFAGCQDTGLVRATV